MKDERNEDRKAAEALFKSIGPTDPEEMSIEDTVNVLRGVCCFLLKELQKTYLYMAQHSIAHDSMMIKDMGEVFSQSEEMLTTFFSDYLTYGQESDDDDDGKA